jgi:hypothetical protein
VVVAEEEDEGMKLKMDVTLEGRRWESRRTAFNSWSGLTLVPRSGLYDNRSGLETVWIVQQEFDSSPESHLKSDS